MSYLHCSRQNDVRVKRTSLSIAPANSYTNAWNWRFDIKVDDEISAADEYGNWYRSTILKVDELQNSVDIDGNSIPIVLVGFRYLDPYG